MIMDTEDSKNILHQMQNVFKQSSSVESELSDHERQTLRRISTQLSDSIDGSSISRIHRLYAEFAANPQNMGLQGGAGEMWTFRDGGDVDISFPLQLAPGTHESNVSLKETKQTKQTKQTKTVNGSFKLNIKPNGNGSELWYLKRMWKLYEHFDKALRTVLTLEWLFSMAALAWLVESHALLIIAVPLVLLALSFFISDQAQQQHGVAPGSLRQRIACGLMSLPVAIMGLLSRPVPAQYLMLMNFSTRTHGPAVSGDEFRIPLGQVNTKGIDLVPFVPAPSEAEELLKEWRERHGQRFKDTSEFVRNLAAHGDLGIVMHEYKHKLWRLSLTEFECQWIRHLPKEQGLVLSIAKHLAKTKDLTDYPINSYPIKMSFFWTVYFSMDSDWSPENVCLNALKVLRFMYYCFENNQHQMPNYFYLEENVLQKYTTKNHRANVPTTEQLANHLCAEKESLADMMMNRLGGVEQLLQKFCSNKYVASNPWKSSSFLQSRAIFQSMSHHSGIALESTMHGVLMAALSIVIGACLLISNVNSVLTKETRVAIVLSLLVFPFLSIAAVSMITPAIAIATLETLCSPALYLMEKVKSRANSEPESRDTEQDMPKIVERVRKLVPLVIGDHQEQLKLLSRGLSELHPGRGFPDNADRGGMRSAFEASPGFSVHELRGHYDVRCTDLASTMERLVFVHGVWFDLAFSLVTTLCHCLIMYWLPGSSEQLPGVFGLVFGILAVQLFTPTAYRYSDLKVTWLRVIQRLLSRLPIPLPALPTWLQRCLSGEAALRIRTGMTAPAVVSLLDARGSRWRSCTDHLESSRLSQLSKGQALCHHAVLSLAAALGATSTNFEPLRMAFYWAEEAILESDWTVDNAFCHALTVLELCRQCHRRSCLPNFFQRNENVALINPETFYGLPKCQAILQHLLLTEDGQANLQLLESMKNDDVRGVQVPEGSNAAEWGCGLLGARVRMLAADFSFRTLVAYTTCLPALVLFVAVLALPNMQSDADILANLMRKVRMLT